MYSQKQVRWAIASVDKNYAGTMSKSEFTRLPKTEFNVPQQTRKKDINREIDWYVSTRKKRQQVNSWVDILERKKAKRLGKIYKKYISFADFAGNYFDRNSGDLRYIADYSPALRMALIRVDDWCQYTKDYRTYVRMAGLVLFDRDSQTYRFLRVGPDVKTVYEALEYIKPAAVRKAEYAGKSCPRQGDVYFIPQRTWNLKSIYYSAHKIEVQSGRAGTWVEWDRSTAIKTATVAITHQTHPTIYLKTPHKAVQQIIVANVKFGRNSGRISGHAD